MTRLDEVSEAIGALRSDVKDIGGDIKKIEVHLSNQNNRIGKLEMFKHKIMGIAIAVSAIVSVMVLFTQYIIK